MIVVRCPDCGIHIRVNDPRPFRAGFGIASIIWACITAGALILKSEGII
jgi:ribosomal protein S27E